MVCHTDQDCGFLHMCNSNFECVHKGVFPLEPYPLFVYILIPCVVSICNLGGLSAGAFRILIFMNMLNYSTSKANSLIFIIITAAALANFFTIIPQKHPHRKATLVDYNLVLIMMPTLIFGTNFGVFLNKLLIELIQDILVTLVLLFFLYVYGKKLWDYRKMETTKERDDLLTESNTGQSLDQLVGQTDPDTINIPYKDIFITFGIFLVVQLVAGITEGAIFGIKHCTLAYYLTFSGFVALTLVILYICRRLVATNMANYIKDGFSYELPLQQNKTFVKLVVGGFMAGLIQGLVGLGSCFIIIYVMMSFDVMPQVASAVSGYIIVFVGAASLIQSLVIGQLLWDETLFLFSLTFGGSLILTFFARKLLKKRKNGMDKAVIIILVLVSVFSIVGVAASIYLTIKDKGFHKLVELQPFCPK